MCPDRFSRRPEQWTEFDAVWRAALSLAGLKDFHAKKFFYRLREAKGEEAAKLAACLECLLQAVEAQDFMPLGALVDVDEFQAMSYGERRFLTGGAMKQNGRIIGGAPSKPYYLAFQHCLAQAAKQTSDDKVVHFVFDSQRELAPLALEMFFVAKRSLPSDARAKIGACVFLERDIVGPPLELADMFAHCWYAYKQEEELDRWRTHALKRLTSKISFLHRYGAQDFETLLARSLSPEQRSAAHAETGQKKGRTK